MRRHAMIGRSFEGVAIFAASMFEVHDQFAIANPRLQRWQKLRLWGLACNCFGKRLSEKDYWDQYRNQHQHLHYVE